MKKFIINFVFTLYNLFSRRLPITNRLPQNAVAALNDFFDAIWVLTIQRNTLRQEFIKKSFSDLNYSFFNGVDGKRLPSDTRTVYSDEQKKIFPILSPNVTACALSHALIYEDMLNKGFKRILILEDDAVFLKQKSSWVSKILSRLPSDWDLVYLGYRDGELRGFFHEVLEFIFRKSKSKMVVSRNVGKGIRTAGGHEFTHAYCVSAEGAKKLLDRIYPIHDTADGVIEKKVLAGDLRAYITIPKLFIQKDEMGSSIG